MPWVPAVSSESIDESCREEPATCPRPVHRSGADRHVGTMSEESFYVRLRVGIHEMRQELHAEISSRAGDTQGPVMTGVRVEEGSKFEVLKMGI